MNIVCAIIACVALGAMLVLVSEIMRLRMQLEHIAESLNLMRPKDAQDPTIPPYVGRRKDG